MTTGALTSAQRSLLKEIFLLADPSAKQGLTLVYRPEIPAEQAGTVLACVPAGNKCWENTTSCSKHETDQVRAFAENLITLGALSSLSSKESPDGGYHTYYIVTDTFETTYASLDPEGFAEAMAIIKQIRDNIKCREE